MVGFLCVLQSLTWTLLGVNLSVILENPTSCHPAPSGAKYEKCEHTVDWLTPTPTGHSVFLALEMDPPFILLLWLFSAKDLNVLKRIYLQLCFPWVCRHGWALGYGNYSESYSSVLIVTLVLWNLEHFLFNKFHTEALINILMGCCLCVCLSATQCPSNKALHSHPYKKLIILQWEKMLHFTLRAIPHVPLISIH